MDPLQVSALAQTLDRQTGDRHASPLPQAGGNPETRYLQVSLDAQTPLLVRLLDVAGIVSLSAEAILPIPSMPPALVGLTEWRGQLLWILDLAYFLQKAPLSHHDSRSLTLIVFSLESTYLGGLVWQVGDIMALDLTQLQSSSTHVIDSTLSPMIHGIVPQSGTPVLDTKVLFEKACQTKVT